MLNLLAAYCRGTGGHGPGGHGPFLAGLVQEFSYFLNLRGVSVVGPHFLGTHLNHDQEYQSATVFWQQV